MMEGCIKIKKERPDEDNRLETYHLATSIKHEQRNNQIIIIPQRQSHFLYTAVGNQYQICVLI